MRSNTALCIFQGFSRVCFKSINLFQLPLSSMAVTPHDQSLNPLEQESCLRWRLGIDLAAPSFPHDKLLLITGL